MTEAPTWTEPEGATPLPDISGLKIKLPVINRDTLDLLEAENIVKAMLVYFGEEKWKKLQFNITDLYTLHKAMFGNVWDWAGQTRRINTNIGPDHLQVEQQLQQLLGNMSYWAETCMSLDEQMARLHHGIVLIHPFNNGNGRWSRMVLNIWLKKNNLPIMDWPASMGKTSEIRDAYIAALKKADNGDYSALIALHEQCKAKA